MVPFPLSQLQARWVARVLSRRIQAPSQAEMRADSLAFYREQQQEGKRSRDAHYLGEHQWGYNQWLARACGDEEDVASTPWRIAMNQQVCEPMDANPSPPPGRRQTAVAAAALSGSLTELCSFVQSICAFHCILGPWHPLHGSQQAQIWMHG